MKKVISTERLPIKMWLDDLEDGASQQAKNLANLPFTISHIAIMPDAHRGYGMPIGGVMATKDVIVPNAVGVDIGCFDKNTEYLTPTGWKNFDNYEGEKVMQFNLKTGGGKFVKPIKYIKEKCDEFIKIKTKYGINQVLSKDHRCLVYKYDRGYKFDQYKVISAEELMKKHNSLKNGFRHRFLTAFDLNTERKLDLTNQEIRVWVMISADGHVDKNRVVLQFKKQRKIDRAKQLLDNCSIEYNKSSHKNGVYRISFLMGEFKKGLEYLWFANKRQLKIIVEEALNWDGNIEDKCFYTRRKQEADFMHYAISAIGKRAVMRADKHYRDGKLDYRVYQYSNIKVGINGTPKTKIKIVKSEDGYKYSFTVPSSFLVVRRGGNVLVTGNCGMCAVKTSLVDIETDTIKKIMGDIRKSVPVGFNWHKKPQFKSLPIDKDHTKIIERQLEKAKKQIGTLGGGNHFIEIQKGDDGYIWLMVHSGSRNLGYTTAKHYNELAKKLNKKWYSQVPIKHDLAFLPIDKAGGYIKDMNFALAFAFQNRKLMMDRIMDAVSDYAKGFDEMINIHHNYASMENHFGQNVWVHRKGATLARKGTMGIIPGSQGSKSYIVKGKGNKDSFESCSHGAGRKMGRNQARRTLDLNDEKAKLEKMGVIHSVRNEKDLDESPGSYKDISRVMANQKDLVDIEVELNPLAVIKG